MTCRSVLLLSLAPLPSIVGRTPRGLLRDSADAGPTGKLRLHVVPVEVAVAQQHEAVKHEVRHFLHQVLSAGVARLVPRLDDLRGLLEDLGADRGHAAVHQAGHVGRLGLAIRLAGGDHGHQVRHRRRSGHGEAPPGLIRPFRAGRRHVRGPGPLFSNRITVILWAWEHP